MIANSMLMNKETAINKIDRILSQVLRMNLKSCCKSMSECIQDDIGIYLNPEKLDEYDYVELGENKFYLGEVVEGKREGYGVSFNDNYLYAGQWSNNKKEGFGFYYMSDGTCYYGGFVEGMFYGENSLFVTRDGVEICADFIKDIMVYVRHSSASFTYTHDGERFDSRDINKTRNGCLIPVLFAAFAFYLIRLIVLLL